MQQAREPRTTTTWRVAWLVAGVLSAYTVLWLLGQGPLGHVYTAEWTFRRIPWLYAPATLLLAVFSRRVVPTVLSILGLVLGVVVGELIGGRFFSAETARLERELTAGGLRSWDPAHPGWWIASIVFVVLTVTGALVAVRSRHRDPSTHR